MYLGEKINKWGRDEPISRPKRLETFGEEGASIWNMWGAPFV